MPDPTLRVATTDDLSVIEALARHTWPTAYGDILSPAQIEYMLQLFYAPEALSHQMAAGQTFLLLEVPEPVGFAAAGPVGDFSWKLHKLYVLPSQQGSGYGVRLLNAVLALAKRAAAQTLTLNVNRYNPAKGFYEQQGFETVSEKDIEIGAGFFMNDYILEKKL
ncbi:MAG: N-acetyltransferase [Sphingobacteriales bacterium]|nr:MAG: N-acetyltransferase [Sphingobacteriales bacterium]